MFEVAELIYNILSNDAGVTAIVGNKIFPIVANQKAAIPFITFDLQELPGFAKGSGNVYNIDVNGFDETFDKTAVLSGAIKNAMAAATEQFTFLGAQTQYQTEKELIIKQTYKHRFFLSNNEPTPPAAPTALVLTEGAA